MSLNPLSNNCTVAISKESPDLLSFISYNKELAPGAFQSIVLGCLSACQSPSPDDLNTLTTCLLSPNISSIEYKKTGDISRLFKIVIEGNKGFLGSGAPTPLITMGKDPKSVSKTDQNGTLTFDPTESSQSSDPILKAMSFGDNIQELKVSGSKRDGTVAYRIEMPPAPEPVQTPLKQHSTHSSMEDIVMVSSESTHSLPSNVLTSKSSDGVLVTPQEVIQTLDDDDDWTEFVTD